MTNADPPPRAAMTEAVASAEVTTSSGRAVTPTVPSLSAICSGVQSCW